MEHLPSKGPKNDYHGISANHNRDQQYWVGSAFLAGFIFKRLHLPPMLGFLLSGFLMNYLGLTNGSLALDQIADLGIILLLFSIGLKLDLKGLSKPEIWGGSTVHALLTILFLTLLDLAHFTNLNLGQAAYPAMPDQKRERFFRRSSSRG